MNHGVTILICAYNGARNLPETLRHLANQKVSKEINWEVIVIDNGSTDNTSAVAAEEWAKYEVANAGFKILEERSPGKNYAFQKGIKSASFGYVLTCDDDNWLNSNYVEYAFRILESDSSIGALGGLGIIKAEEPVFLKEEELKKVTVSGSQSWASTDHWVYGAGSLYRREILIELFKNGWQPITSGRTGVNLICGEDVEICLMIYLCGFKIIADDTLTFKHFIPSRKQNKRYILNMAFWVNYSNALLNSYYSIIHRKEKPVKSVVEKLLLESAISMFKQALTITYQKVKSLNNLKDEDKISFQSTLGTFLAILGNRNKIIGHTKHIQQILAKTRKISQVNGRF
ncbi:glycosyltransferase family 2 protein [Flavihumibacter sp. R14]|nr:glycosyltransferase family 2 protein [Flavihumibacter soli]